MPKCMWSFKKPLGKLYTYSEDVSLLKIFLEQLDFELPLVSLQGIRVNTDSCWFVSQSREEIEPLWWIPADK